jgi:hypothetical protein
VFPGRDEAMFEALAVDLRNIPIGIRVRQLDIVSPKVRTATPRSRRWAATASP